MTSERLTIPMLQLSPFLDTARPDAIVNVAASQLKEHLAGTYGDDVPSVARARWAAGLALSSVGVYSTSEELNDPDVHKFLPNWLRLMEPLAQHNVSLGKVVDAQLISRETPAEHAAKAPTQDLVYCAALYDVLSVAIAGELCVYPTGRDSRQHAATMIEQGVPIKSESQKASEKDSLNFILHSDLFKVAHRKKLVRLQGLAVSMTQQSNNNLQRLRNIMPELAFEGLDIIDPLEPQ